MDKEYIREQITLLLMGEETEISENEIRESISRDPELQKEYQDLHSTLELTSKRNVPPVSEERWDKFMLDLHERLEYKKSRGVLVKFAEFYRSPVRLTAAASVTAILLIGIVLLTHTPDAPEPLQIAVLEYLPQNIEQVDSAYVLAENLLPTEEELSLIEEIYAGFDEYKESEDLSEDSSDFYRYEFEQYFQTNGSDSQEDKS